MDSMLRNIAATARTALNANLAGVRRARTMSTIPVNNVARIVRMKVAGEEDAIKADAIVKKVNQQMQTAGLAGFQKVKRTVCKSEWAYEVEVVFSGLDNFKAYMDSDFRAKTMMPALEEAGKLAVGEVYSGNRVYDEF